ncbi:MAG: alanine--tRNA ligase [Epsilonproteobacteria bacterium]|nr:alanine--tRNA ligase [Campylobacterota bacterium]|tara:strand:+ start:37 stop:2631 length:2595 start_codon:yes stop_codon:yes gene_type:complete
MKSQELRKKFYDYFVSHGHEKVASSSLIPAQDPTLLFTNAGMNQFKDVFLGKEQRSYARAVTIQKCVRAGGKHNDLDNVGFTQRHLTFFEMMGNFSFGDYFKKEAIRFAWNFLTKEIGFKKDVMYITVHLSDQESFDIWHHDMGVEKSRIFKLDEDNFWQMGDVGPCGPCTEIFIDRGTKVGCGLATCSPACDCDRFLEVWNNVFMQFDRQQDGTDVPLQQTGVDTGMGLERLAMLVQNKESVFESDVFKPCFDKITELTGHGYQDSSDIKAAFNVLGDHVRSATFLISDGCAPANDGRGYVLRKIIRRAALFAQKLTDKNIFPELSGVLIDYMSDAYPDLVVQKDRIASVLKIEIERFADNLIRGQRILQDYIAQASDKVIDGKQIFTLYDTYGFPVEVTELIASEQGFTIDKQGFDVHMEQQRQRSGKKMKQSHKGLQIEESMKTVFTGYHSLHENGQIIGLVVNEALVNTVSKGQECWLIPDKTPFYVECGGQVNDEGSVTIAGVATKLLDLKNLDDAILIKIKAPCDINLGQDISMQVDEYWRKHTMKNHTATHLLQAALQQIFGKQVKQAGSVVTRDYLRFDYTYHQPLTNEEIKQVEDLVNQKIWQNIPVEVRNTTYKQAVQDGVIAFFGDKYNPDDVRAIIIGDYSKELCGGTHVSATGDIGIFKIVEEVALAAGQRRIVAYTGGKALQEYQQDFSIVKQLGQDLKIKSDQIIDVVAQLQDQIRDLHKHIKNLKKEQWKQQLPTWLDKVTKVNGISYLALELDGYSVQDFREIAHSLQQKKPGFYFFIQNEGKKSTFLATVDKSVSTQVDMKKFKIDLQEKCSLRGGGNATTLQGGGPNVDSNCITFIKNWLQTNIN